MAPHTASRRPRAICSPRPALSHLPRDAEKFLETLLTVARAAAADGQSSLAYQIASKADAAFAPGTDISTRSMGERDDYTSLVWLAGTTALQRLGRPADAAAMFVRYAQGGRSLQVLTKGPTLRAGRSGRRRAAEATGHFEAAARYPDLFDASSRSSVSAAPSGSAASAAQRARRAIAFQNRSHVAATRHLGRLGIGTTVFVRPPLSKR